MLHERLHTQISRAVDMDFAHSIISDHSLFTAPKAKQIPHIHDPSRIGFMFLPGEIRNHIYRLVLTQEEAINGRRTKLPAVSLLRLSKTIHEEASSILYAENTFTFGVSIHFSNLKRMGLHCFPLGVDVWPAKTYHKWLRKLHIGISFTPGNPIDISAPAFLLEDIRQMRIAYAECWNDLDITYEICEGTTHLLTFTMAWLKFRCLAPLAHPRCTIKTDKNIPTIVRWCLERTLQGRDPTENLHHEQQTALREARQLAEDSYQSGMHRLVTDLSWRLVWGCALEHTRGPIFNWGVHPPIFAPTPMNRRIYDQRQMYRQVETTMTDRTITDILLEDNEWRTLAALEMPQEKDLVIERCVQLRVYFALQEMAAKIMALESSMNP